MTKAELLDKIAELKPDDEIEFCLLVERDGWQWQLLNIAIPHPGDPHNVFPFVTSNIIRDTLEDISSLA